MKLHGDITINRTVYPAGADLPWMRIYPFFLLHMLILGLSGFWMAYGPSPAPVAFLFLHGEYDADFQTLRTFSSEPVHQQAKREYARWYRGYHIVVSEVLRSYGDGAFDHVTPNSRAGDP